MEFKAKFFDELTARELYEIIVARQEIFLMEQNIVCRDLDGVDYDSLHCFLWEDGRVVAYLRAYPGGEDLAIIGRVLSVTHKVGLGKELIQRSIPLIKETFGAKTLSLHSQCYAEGFYRKFGFEPCGEVFLEEGIEHIEMVFR